MGNSNSYAQRNASKIKQRQNQIKERQQILHKILSELNVDEKRYKYIINSTANQLALMLNQQKTTSRQITACLCLQASNIGLKLKLITEDNFLESIEASIRCDEERLKSGKKNWRLGDEWNMNKFLAPLYGIPISIKDTIDMDGFASTVGVSARVDRLKKDGTIMHCIRNSGMIPFVKTNIPQLAMTMQSTNYLWGRAVNPWDVNRAVGGSSGGEGGLIAARGSVLGVGSDIGGSIRIPAVFCGISSLNPYSRRLSFSGHTPYIESFDGLTAILPSLGPLARSVDDLALWMKTVTSEEFYKGKHDRYVKLHQFDDKVFLDTQKKKLKIGYLINLQFCQASPASQRAVREVIEMLKKMGHQFEEISIPNERSLIRAFYGCLLGQGEMQTFTKMLEGEDLIQQYKNLSSVVNMNCCTRGIASALTNKLEPRVGFIIDSTAKLSSHQYNWMSGLIKQCKQDWQNYLLGRSIDLVILPGFGCQACLNGISGQLGPAAAYTFIFNVLDVPSGIVPVTVVKQQQQTYESKHEDRITETLRKNALNTVGLPVGIEVVGFPYQQEKILGLMKVIEENVKFNRNYEPKY